MTMIRWRCFHLAGPECPNRKMFRYERHAWGTIYFALKCANEWHDEVVKASLPSTVVDCVRIAPMEMPK